MERGCLAAVGAAIALVSAFFVATAVVESATGGDGKTSPGVYAGLVVFFGGLFLAGVYLTWRMLKKRPAGDDPLPATGPARAAVRTEAEIERQLLRVVEDEHGRVTVPEVAARCDLTVADAKAALDRLVTNNVARIHVTDGGVLVYVFPGFLSDDDKARATDF